MLVGKYGPETDAALEKLALAGINIGIPAGLSLLGGPAGFSVGETLMSVLMGAVAAATPPRHDNLMMGVMPFGPGGSRLQRMQAGEAIGDAEMRLLFNQTPESLVRIGRKGGLASGAARRAKAAAGELADEGMYTGPEIGRETTHEASMAIDAEFAHLKDAFKQTDAEKCARQIPPWAAAPEAAPTVRLRCARRGMSRRCESNSRQIQSPTVSSGHSTPRRNKCC